MRKDGAEFKGKQEIISRHLCFWEGLATFFLVWTPSFMMRIPHAEQSSCLMRGIRDRAVSVFSIVK